jgi:3-deoxy-manno-octulosonate cytidylyltransferase (CMP-KDO synthetase)
MNPLIIIPSRKNSKRLPNKPMVEFAGKTLIRHVWEKAIDTGYTTLVATDSQEIKDHVESFGGVCYITSSKHRCGTDRVREAASIHGVKGYDAIINLQGDLPFIDPEQIIKSTIPLNDGFDVGTLICKMEDTERSNKNCVKAICSKLENELVYFCHWFLRASLEYGYHHVGVYSFKPETLEIPLSPSKHEVIEDLEQLRFIENGMTISAVKINKIIKEVNTPGDIYSITEELR